MVLAFFVFGIGGMGLLSAIRLQLSPHHWYITETQQQWRSNIKRGAQLGPYQTEQQCSADLHDAPRPFDGFVICEELRDDEAHVPPRDKAFRYY